MDRIQEIEKQLEQARQRPWSASQYPEVAAWLKSNRRPLETAVRGTRRPKCYSPLIAEEEMSDTLGMLGTVALPLADISSELARALAARAMLRLEAGKVERSWEDIVACYRLSRLIAQQPTLVEAAVAMRINGYACQSAWALAKHGKLSREQARDIRRALKALPPLPDSFRNVDSAARLAFLDFVIRVLAHPRPYSDAGSLWETIGNAFVQLKIANSFDWNEVLRIVNDYFDRVVVALQMPQFAERQEALRRIHEEAMVYRRKHPEVHHQGRYVTSSSILAETRFLLLKVASSGQDRNARSRIAGHVLIAVALPGMLIEEETRAKMQLDFTEILLALAEYRAEHSKCPENLAELVPTYLDEIPRDRFTDENLLYHRDGEGFLLYSRGPNGNDEERQKDDIVIEMP